MADAVRPAAHRPVAYGSRARIGVILPSGNVAAEAELAAMMPDGVALHVTRLRLTGSSPEQLLAMAEGVEDAASLVADTRPALIGFHCTAVTTLSPELETSILERAAGASGGLPVVATSQAVLAAHRALGAARIVLVTPYLRHINDSEVSFLAAHGLTVLDAVGLGIDTPADMYRVEPDEWLRIVREHADPRADAYFVSCTAIRTAEMVERIEDAVGKPVVTSNLAMAWHFLRSVGIVERQPGFGKLMSL